MSSFTARRWRAGWRRRGRRRSSPAPRSRRRGREARLPPLAASNAPSPRARSAAISPASTSPVPAVASHAGAGGAKPIRPSGEATIVSGPLNTITAPLRRAASSARSALEPAISPNSFANSPWCGVMIASCPRNLSGSPRCVIPSASMTLGALLVSASVRSGGMSPMPGPTSRQPMRSSFTSAVSTWTIADGRPSIGREVLTRT